MQVNMLRNQPEQNANKGRYRGSSSHSSPSGTRRRLSQDGTYADDRVDSELEQTQKEVEKLRGENNELLLRLQDYTSVEMCKYTLNRVRRVSKIELFAKMKFIPSEAYLDEFQESDSIGKFILDRLNVEHDERKQFWRTYKREVDRAITQQRSTVMNYIKKAWMGKCLLL